MRDVKRDFTWQDTDQEAGGQSSPAPGGCTCSRGAGAGAGPGGCGGSCRTCGRRRRSPNPGGTGNPTPRRCRERQAEVSSGVRRALPGPSAPITAEGPFLLAKLWQTPNLRKKKRLFQS